MSCRTSITSRQVISWGLLRRRRRDCSIRWRERFMRQCDIRVDKAVSDRAALDEKGYSSLYVAVDGQLAGLVPYSDAIRSESRPVIERLHTMGIKNTIMLTGDNAVVARAVCRDIGLTDHFADMLPA